MNTKRLNSKRIYFKNLCVVHNRNSNIPNKTNQNLAWIYFSKKQALCNCLSVTINKVYTKSFCMPTETYNHSLTEKHGILKMRTLKCGSVHKK